MTELQARIQAHIDALVGTGPETGLQVAVYQDDALIVHAVAGAADPDTGRALESSTPIFSFSTGKNVAATLAHVLVARGVLDYDRPITDLWPEFGIHGKATATLRHVLTHTVRCTAHPHAWRSASPSVGSAPPSRNTPPRSDGREAEAAMPTPTHSVALPSR